MTYTSNNPADDIAYANTDRELWREGDPESGMSYYEPSIHVTEQGGIGINVGGTVYVKTLREWHALANRRGRPTSKIGTQAEKLLDWEVSGVHYSLWLNLGSVCWQIRWRLWRFGFEFVYWRSYDP